MTRALLRRAAARAAFTLVAGVVSACGDGPTPPGADPGAASADDLLLSLMQAAAASPLGPGAPTAPAGLPSAACSYADGRYTCPPFTDNSGTTVTRSFAFYDAAGAPQRQYDALTTASLFNSVSLRGKSSAVVSSVSLGGKTEQTVGRGTSVVEFEHAFTQTASGLLGRETRRTIDGTGGGTSRITFAEPGGARTLTITSVDTTRALILPVVERPANPAAIPAFYPLGGSQTTVTTHKYEPALEGVPGGFSSRMVITYGSNGVATLEMTVAGSPPQVCTLDLNVRPPKVTCPNGAWLTPQP